MSIGHLQTVAAALAVAGALASGAAVASDAPAARFAVEFVAPEKFTDVQASARPSSTEAAEILADLAQFVREAGARHVPEGRSLSIRVTDIDLAGEFEPWRGPQFQHTRFMREGYPSRIALEFRLKDAEGRLLSEGARTLRDPIYLTRSIRVANDRLRYEKSLLEDWLRSEFAR